MKIDLVRPFRLAGERFRSYADDLKDGVHRKVPSAALLIFLTSVGPAMSFGEYLSNNLQGSYGVLEVLVSTALCGTIFSLISGSPLVIVGATGPFSIFGFNCYRLAQMYDVPFIPWMAWIMLISGLQHIFLGLIGASTWYLPYITSFSGQVFGVLISMIYIVESCQNVAESFYQGSAAGRLDAAFFYAIIAFGQLAACMYLAGARTWLVFNDKIRDIVADYGPSLTIFAFTGFTLIPSFSSVNIVRINIPTTFNTTSGRDWLVSLDHPDLSSTAKGLAFFPALVLTALYFFDHNVSALLTHRIEYNLKRKVCYDWDFMVLGFMMIVCGFLGLPPCNGLIPNSPMHSKALVVYKSRDQLKKEAKRGSGSVVTTTPPPSAYITNTSSQVRQRKNSNTGMEPVFPSHELAEQRLPPQFDRIVDQRVSNLLQSGMVAVMLVILPVLALVPTSVVTGLFLFMGVESLLDGDIFSRLIFPFVEERNWFLLNFDARLKKNNFIQSHRREMIVYTLIQLAAFGVVFYVTQTVASIAFPVFILLLVPLRFNVLPRIKFFHDDFIGTMDQPLIESDDDKERRLESDDDKERRLEQELPPPDLLSDDDKERRLEQELPPPDLLSAFSLPPRPAAAAISQDDTLHSVAVV